MQPYFQTTFPPGEFRARRAAVMEQIGAQAVAVIAGAAATGAFDRFRQTNEFFYLCGVEVPHAYLLIDARSRETTLYLPHHDAKHERSEGAQLHCDASAEVAARTGIERIKPLSQLSSDLAHAREVYLPHAPGEGRQASRDTLVYARKLALADPWDAHVSREDHLKMRIADITHQAAVHDLSPILDRLRLHKSEHELVIMRKAGEITALATRRAVEATRAGLFEYQLAAVADHVFADAGAQGPGYRPIVASGANIWNAHYYRNDAQLNAGELVLFDYAPDVANYTSDIGRMWPVDGRYSPQQRELYGFVVAYHEVLLKVLQPGFTAAELAREAADTMRPTWEAWPFTQANYREAARQMLESGVAFTHPVGMAVHDVGHYRGEPLQPGLVFALDPQLWVHDESLYIRVEDTVAITIDGVEVLTGAMPRDLDETEALMQNASN